MCSIYYVEKWLAFTARDGCVFVEKVDLADTFVSLCLRNSGIGETQPRCPRN